MIDLVSLEENTLAEVTKIIGGSKIRARLESLGIYEGVKIKKISKSLLKGPVIVEVKSCKVAIGYGMAKKILVKKSND
ncbi:MAG: ferrous iron transport protein A [candidate division WOR-3 bacterium]|nr:ferrous iron transport protein A [candidate division WOR-3 bacterium]